MGNRKSSGESRPPPLYNLGSTGLAEAILQTMDQPLLVLRYDLTVEEANSAFYRLFKVDTEETRGRLLYELGNGQWNIPELRRLLEEILPQQSVVEHYRLEHKFPEIGKRIMILNARRLPPEGDRPELILLVISDRTETEQARFELEGHVEFGEKLIDSIREALLVLDWDLKVVRANQPFYDAFQVSPADTKGRLIYELGNRQWDIPRLRELLENVLPDNNAFDDVEVEHDFEHVGRRIMLINGRRLDHLDLILLAIRDVTEQRRMEKERETRVGELHHRIKNVLTTVDALVRRTLRDSGSLEEFGHAFESRLGAMARTQDLLVRAPKGSVDMSEILRLELQAHGGREGGNFNLDGPAIALPQDAVQAFAMAVHELTTNAVKHGAFASHEGRVEIRWTLEAGEEGATLVMFRWRERCPIIISPSRTGYGTSVLEAAFRHTLKGSSRLTLHPDGAEFSAEFQ
ncbi:MAG: PAS domain-containing protein, partial [Mesorhizobium sp.]